MSKLKTQKEFLLNSVNSFHLRSGLSGWPGACEPFFASIRKYYLLLPIDGVRIKDWHQRPKGTRRGVIKRHLDAVCTEGTVELKQVEVVDEWLGNMSSPRDRVVLYGRQLQELYGSNCFLCGARINEGEHTVDHFLPISRGGGDGLDNLMLCHQKCNAGKGNRLLGDEVCWAPRDLQSEELPKTLRYLVHLRDDFSCQVSGCGKGILTREPITVSRRNETGISCYDNIEVQCLTCAAREER